MVLVVGLPHTNGVLLFLPQNSLYCNRVGHVLNGFNPLCLC